MKSVVAAAFYTTLGMSLAGLSAIMAVDAMAYSMAYQAAGIGAETPIEGVTLGWLIATLGASIWLLWKGVKSLIALGGYITLLKQTFDTLITRVAALEELPPRVDRLEALPTEVAALQRWRRTIVDPSLTRQGMMPPQTDDCEGGAA